MSETIFVSEIFGPTIQGEGLGMGSIVFFVRVAGCDGPSGNGTPCKWCDTSYALSLKNAKKMSCKEILDKVDELRNIPSSVFARNAEIVLTGGNPALYDFEDFIHVAKMRGYVVSCETQGTLAPDWFSLLHRLIISPKGPSSGQTDYSFNNSVLFMECEKNLVWKCHFVEVKIVIADDSDYQFAKRLRNRWSHSRMHFVLQVYNPYVGEEKVNIDDLLTRYKELINKVKQDKWYNVRVLPQMHVLLWGNERGV